MQPKLATTNSYHLLHATEYKEESYKKLAKPQSMISNICLNTVGPTGSGILSYTYYITQSICLLVQVGFPPPSSALLLTLRWGRHRLCIYSLEVIVSHFLFTADSGQYGAVAAQLIIAHAGPTEGMALWNTSLSAQPPVMIAFHYTVRLCIRSQ